MAESDVRDKILTVSSSWRVRPFEAKKIESKVIPKSYDLTNCDANVYFIFILIL